MQNLNAASDRRTRNFIISGTSYWNPGDDFVRDGVIQVLRQTFPGEHLNFHFYNFAEDQFPKSKFRGTGNEVSAGDLELCRDFIDGVIIAGLSAGHEIKDLYNWVLANGLEDRVFLIGAGYENSYCAGHVLEEPEATLFRKARLIIGRTARHPELLKTAATPYVHLNCPALLSVPEVKPIATGRKIQRIGFSIQLPHETGIVNQTCGPEVHRLACQLLLDLARTHEVELVAHHKSEYFLFLRLLRGTSVPVIYSSFYHDLHDVYRRYDCVVTTRLHSSLYANGHGIPGIIVNDTDRHTHTLAGFPHSAWVNTRERFDHEFARLQKLDLERVATEMRVFKEQLTQKYVQLLRPALPGPPPAPAIHASPDLAVRLGPAEGADTFQFDSEKKEQQLVRSLLKPGMTVLDVGAHVGKYTKLFSLLVGRQGRVFSFEPTPASAQTLAGRIEQDSLDNVTLIRKAVADCNGVVTLHQFPEEYSSWNGLGRPSMEDPRDNSRLVPIVGETQVAAITLDEFCQSQGLTRIDYLKLDVEGAELRALEGARELLEKKAIRHLQFEISQKMLEGLNTRARPVFDFLSARGYECHTIAPDGAVGEKVADSTAFYENYIAFPARASRTGILPVSPGILPVDGPGAGSPGDRQDACPTTLSPSDGEREKLPIHFFTIVLNGQPFIRHHIEVLRQLPFRWHWHIVEGVADLTHDTAWSKALGGRITPEIQRHGLSNDGTTEYLDRLAKNFPGQVTIHRKPAGEFWDGKLEMVNAPLQHIREDCLLWQVDVDELWTTEQLTFARRLFLARPDKTAAFYLCHYFVGENLVITTRDTYGNHTDYEWIRTWRYKPGCRWVAHEPPRLCQPDARGQLADLATLNPFRHRETEALDLVFQHYAYTTEAQLRFKEIYYGYAGAVEQWRGLQAQKKFPVRLADHFAWVKDEAQVHTAVSEGIIPLARTNERGEWEFAAAEKLPAHELQSKAGVPPAPAASRPHPPGASGSGQARGLLNAPAARQGREDVRTSSSEGAQLVPQRLLFVRTDSIGDAVLAASMLPHLRRHYPGAQIGVLCQEHLSELYLACPFVDAIISFDKRRATEDPAYRDTVIAEIGQFQPGLILNSIYSSEPLTELLIHANRGPEIIGLDGDLSNLSAGERRDCNALYSRLIASPGAHKPELERHRDFLAGLGIDAGPLQPSMWTTPDDERFADEFLAPFDPARTIALFPFTQHDLKNYPRFGPALQEFAGWNFLVFGGPESEAASEALTRLLPGPSLNLAGRTSLRELAALIRRCRILVGSDSCGVHIACAMGVPNVVVLGGGHFGRFLPYSPLTSAVCEPLSCYRCNWVCSFGSFPCTKGIEPAVVAEAVRCTLEKPSSKPRLFVPGPRHPAADSPAPAPIEQFIDASAVELIEVSNNAVDVPGLAGSAPTPTPKDGHARVDSALKEVRDNWNEFGKRDPLWSILTVDSKKNNQWDLVEFFAAGEREISGVMRYLKKVNVPVRRGKAMDFGCGVGRLTQALCGEFEECHGVDIAESMVDLANQYNRFGSRCHYHVNVAQDLRLFADDTFDFIYSNIVLQHNKPVHSRKFIQEFLRILAPGGMVVFQIPSEPVFARSDESQLPAGAFRALLTAASSSLETTAGACLDVTLRIRNTSAVPWPAARLSTSRFALRLGNHWLSEHGHTIALDDGRTTLTKDVQPGDEIELSVSARVPTRQGNYILELDLVQESVAWFKDKASPTLKIPVLVTGSALPQPASDRDAVSELHGWFQKATHAVPDPARAASEGSVLVPRMEMNGIPKAEVIELLEGCGGRIVDVTEDNAAAGWLGFRYCVAKAPAPAGRSRSESSRPAEWIHWDQPAPCLETSTAPACFKVSAIVSACNAGQFLPHCLNDLTGQTLYQKGELEIIVINSGSSQNEEAIVREFQRSHPNIVYLRTERETLYAAWNRGVQLARGRFVTNANVDDAHRPDALEKLAAALESHPEADLAYNHVAWTSVKNDSFANPAVRRTVVYPAYHPALALFYCFTGCHQFWRRSAFEKIGLFQPSFTAVGDYEILQRFASAGLQAVLVPEVLSLFYQNPRGLTAQSGRSQQEEAVVRETSRRTIAIERIFRIDAGDPSARARAWVALGNLALDFPVPWLEESLTDGNFALHCCEQAVRQDPACWPAIHNRTVLYNLCGRGTEWESEMSKLPPLEAAVLRQALARKDWNLIAVHVPFATPALEWLSGDGSKSASPAPVRSKPRLAIHWRIDPAAAAVPMPVRWLGPIFNPSGYASEAINFIVPLSRRLNLGIFHQNNIYSEKFVAGLPAEERATLFYLRDKFASLSGGITICHNPANGFAHPADSTYRVGRTMFETDRISPAWVSQCNQMDEIWVPSRFNVETFAASGVERDKLFVVPEAVDEQEFDPARHAPLPLPNRAAFNFLSIFEWSSRKGWDVLLSAYLREFSAGEDVCLYLRTYLFSRPDGDPAEALWELIRDHAATLGLGGKKWPRIELIAEQVPLADLPALYRAADCLVAPSRGEGWGRPHHEAMMMGLPVIATNWSGNTEFMNAENSYLLDYEPADINQVEPELRHYRGHRWANPSESHLRALMRRVQQNPAEAREKGECARAHMLKHFSRGPVTDQIVSRLEAIQQRLTVPSCPATIARIPKPVPNASLQKQPALHVAWEGSFLDLGSLSHVNREITRELVKEPGVKLTRVCKNVLPGNLAGWPGMQEMARGLHARPDTHTQVTVRHAWPPDWQAPASGLWVLIQPWEFGVLPAEWVRQLGRVNEVWAPSEYVRRIYVESGVDPARVKVVPNGIDPAVFRPEAVPMKLATQKRFKFLFVGGTIQRKGPDLLLQAYLDRFTAADDVCLVIKDFGGKSVYAGQTFEAQIQAAQAKANAPEILYLNGDLPPDQLPGLYTACDCLVHPYRGEGFGLPVLEAMACGLPVIVTGGGATDDFATDEFAYRLPALRRPLGAAVGGLELARQGWLLEPSPLALAEAMTEVFRNPGPARAKGRAASLSVRRDWTWQRAAQIAAQRLQDLVARCQAAQETLAKRRARTAPAMELPPVARLGQLNEARAAVREKQFGAAWNLTCAAIEARPHHPEGYLLLAEIAQASGDRARARHCAQRALQLAPKWKPARVFMKSLPAGAQAGGRTDLPLPRAAGATPDCPRLSVCLIVRNEAQFLGRCLESVRHLAHQIVVVDTGSTDATVDIARRHGAEVHSFPWRDDFSAARNAALEHATDDWVLVLDADEELSMEGRASLQAELKAEGVMAYRLPILDRGREEEGCSYVPRLFRNAPGLFFVGRVHEQAFSSVEVRRQEWGLENRLGKSALIHHGYAQEVTLQRRKNARNLALLERAVEEMPNEPNLLMNHGLELVRAGQFEAGLEAYWEAFHLLAALPAEQVIPELREALLTQLASHLLGAKDFNAVAELLRCPLAKAQGLSATLHFSLGLALLELKQFAAAAEQMSQCLSKRNQPALTPVNLEIRRAGPRHCLALCLNQLKQTQRAAAAFAEARAEDPNSRPVCFDFARFLVEQGQPVEALKLLHDMIPGRPDDAEVWLLGGRIALGRAEFLEFARDWTGEAIQHLPQHPQVLLQRAEALLLSGQTEASLALWRRAGPQATARPLAARLICELDCGHAAGLAGDALEPEPILSEEFLKWYRRLLECGAARTVSAVNSRIDQVRRILPSAGRVLDQALMEADQATAV